MKKITWPTSRFVGPKTGVLIVGWSLKTITFVRGTLPVLLTEPLNTSGVPGWVGPGGQNLVTAMAGIAQTVQVALAELETTKPATSCPVTLIVSGKGPHNAPPEPGGW